ncbi:hypothetical protein HK099_001774, partial [Clydaea vesicula]
MLSLHDSTFLTEYNNEEDTKASKKFTKQNSVTYDPNKSFLEGGFFFPIVNGILYGAGGEGKVWNRIYSDIIVKALGQTFHLHKLILIQNTYFAGMLTGKFNFVEADQEVIELKFDDENIDKVGLSTVFASMYGYFDNRISSENVKSILSTASYFGEEKLENAAFEFILSDINNETVLSYLNFAREYYHGNISESIIDSIFTYLCRDAAVDPKLIPVLRKMDAEFLGLLIGSDCLFVKDEEHRYNFIKTLFEEKISQSNQKRKNKFLSKRFDETVFPEEGFPSPPEIFPSPPLTPTGTPKFDKKVLPRIKKKSMNHSFLFPSESPQNLYIFEATDESSDEEEEIDQEISLIKDMSTKAVIYCHLGFKTLLSIKNHKTIKNEVLDAAYWNQQELKMLIQSSPPDITSLGIVYDKKTQEELFVPTDDTEKIDDRKLSDFMLPSKHFLSKFPPFRFGFEFKDLNFLHTGNRNYSEPFTYCGSNWVIYIQKVLLDGVTKLGVYLQRNVNNNDENSSCDNIYVDKRIEITACFKIFCFVVKENNSNQNLDNKLNKENILNEQSGKFFILESKP